MKQLWTIIGVADVPRSFRWYQRLFRQHEQPPAHSYFAQVLDDNGTVLLCLHKWGAHEHPTLKSPRVGAEGNGLILFFRVDDFEATLESARRMDATFEEEPLVNPNTGTREFSLRDPDGYLITISSL
jgi:catechol 2,3-dioxygenase-like lactoylglutathione lyase family enzyme